MEKVNNNDYKGKLKTLDLSMDDFNCKYAPHDEWKLLELERNNPIHAKQDFIGEYGLMIDDNDFNYMCDYLLSKGAPPFMNNMEEKLEEKKCKLVGTPRERIARMEQEFDDWARTQGYIEEPK
ncbi:hypothetical protein Tco_0049012 [Tanacetum coccineum]